jgi:pullulanase/glycogen debranching enzyme
MRSLIARCWPAFAALWLAACGGGGGGGGDQPPPAPQTPPPAAATVRIHYQRSDASYAGWGVYSWEGPKVLYTDWPSGDKYRFDKTDAYGVYVDIPVDTAKTQMQFLVNKGTDGSNTSKAPDCDLKFSFRSDIATQGQEVWVKADQCRVFDTLAATRAISFAQAKALWLQRDVIAWPSAATGSQYRLYHAASGGIAVDSDAGVTGADGFFDLTPSTGIGSGLSARYPHLSGATALAVPAAAQSQAGALLRGQLVVVELAGGKPRSATQLQLQGVLDDLYAAAAAPQTLGVSFAADGTPTFRLWAPTARSVTLDINGQSLPMARDDASGVWTRAGDKAWTNSAYYTYTVQVWSRKDGAVVTNTVTDPYAVTLDADVYGGPQQRAMVADLNAAALKPAHWDADAAPALVAPEDAVLYELHVRDFSATDASVPAAARGKYTAFAQTGTQGMQHLQAMATAGLTHVHLLPAFDFASVNEGGCTTPQITNTDPLSQAPQAAVAAAKDSDCFNWGYDPKHYGAPEGSYATDAADGAVRVREFRQMVQGLHGAGLRVVMDVVYNHTAGNFLDKIVPGYYYRLNADGEIETSSCCQNTAPEFAMMEKLMTDTLVRWARDYHVDGFRFDIMGHLPLAAVQRAKAAVDAAIGASRGMYFYGEAWNFGEVANDRLFVQARQARLAGTGIGSFNDRLRDAVRGGGPFDGGNDLVLNQGFNSGLCVDGNALAGATCTDAQRAALRQRQTWIRLSMAGGLKDFMLAGQLGGAIDYNGQPAGYTSDPQELVNYVGVHDGQTLYDISQYKHPAGTSAAQRARAQVVALAPVLLGQGIPFLHAGDELLRSKSFDSDSYNAGDWFNRVDWSGAGNGLDVMGLPSAEKNQANWTLIGGFLANPNIVPAPADIAATREAVKDLLKVRRSSTMFRLRSADEVKRCVSFPDAAAQADGLVVMQIGLGDASCGDGAFKRAVVLINAAPGAQAYAVPALAGRALQLHPVQAAGSDPVVKTAGFDAAAGRFNVPGRSAAVFVEP